MKVDIIPIGNSKGIRIPKALLEQCGFHETAELTMHSGQLVLRPGKTVRKNWGAAFAKSAKKARISKDLQEWKAVQNTFDDAWKW